MQQRPHYFCTVSENGQQSVCVEGQQQGINQVRRISWSGRRKISAKTSVRVRRASGVSGSTHCTDFRTNICVVVPTMYEQRLLPGTYPEPSYMCTGSGRDGVCAWWLVACSAQSRLHCCSHPKLCLLCKLHTGTQSYTAKLFAFYPQIPVFWSSQNLNSPPLPLFTPILAHSPIETSVAKYAMFQS